MKKTLEQWLKEVDAILSKRCGVTRDDLPDCPYADWYSQGVTAKSAAARAIKMSADY